MTTPVFGSLGTLPSRSTQASAAAMAQTRRGGTGRRRESDRGSLSVHTQSTVACDIYIFSDRLLDYSVLDVETLEQLAFMVLALGHTVTQLLTDLPAGLLAKSDDGVSGGGGEIIMTSSLTDSTGDAAVQSLISVVSSQDVHIHFGA